MIDEENRFWTPTGCIFPGGPSSWCVLDWEQRRTIWVTMDEEQDEDVAAIQHLSRHIDTLDPSVRSVYFSLDGTLLSTSNEMPPDIGEKTTTWYPSITKAGIPRGVETVLWSDLTELDRLGPNVDLVSYKDKTAVDGTEHRKAVIKYYFRDQFIEIRWDELNIVMRLPPHRYILPLDRLVLDRPQGRILGFSTPYIPGGSLDSDSSRVFKLKWLRQLTQAVDNLNLKYGIMHHDIAARNLLVNPSTDDVVLFDFNYAIRIGLEKGPRLYNRDDVTGVIFTLYEIITHDEDSRGDMFDRRDPEKVQQLDEWEKHPDVLLDHPVSEYRSVLNEWVNQRRTGRQVSIYTEASEYIDWPNVVIGMNGYQVEHADSDDNEHVTINWARPIRNRSSPLPVGHSQTAKDAAQPAADEADSESPRTALVDRSQTSKDAAQPATDEADSESPRTAALTDGQDGSSYPNDDKPAAIDWTRTMPHRPSAVGVDEQPTFQEAQQTATDEPGSTLPEAATVPEDTSHLAG
ncbi:hypothetical protein MBLNU457_7424t1 [Dothideomycetes sp. NU457]